jgi:hypothetical protein
VVGRARRPSRPAPAIAAMLLLGRKKYKDRNRSQRLGWRDKLAGFQEARVEK